VTPRGASRLAARFRATPAIYLADQALSSGTNFLAVVLVARNGTPKEFGLFSILLVTFYVASGFNRAVPHAIAMTMEWDDERCRSGYFFLPPLAIGTTAAMALAVTFAVVDRSFVAPALLILPMLLQDATRMHAFAIQKPQVALLSDAVWLAVEGAGFFVVSSGPGAAVAWGLGGLCALLATRPWRIRIRVQRRPISASAVSAGLEYATTVGVAYLTPLLASPIITVVGVGALQGTNVIRGPIVLIVQGLLVHRMTGPPITPGTCMRAALQLSSTTLGMTLICIPPLFLLRDVYGPRLLGSTWSQVEPLVLPALLALGLASAGFGPATVVRKMGRFTLSAKLQGALAPLFVMFPLAGAAAGGTTGFLYATGGAFAVFSAVWWIVLQRVATRSATEADLAVV